MDDYPVTKVNKFRFIRTDFIMNILFIYSTDSQLQNEMEYILPGYDQLSKEKAILEIFKNRKQFPVKRGKKHARKT